MPCTLQVSYSAALAYLLNPPPPFLPKAHWCRGTCSQIPTTSPLKCLFFLSFFGADRPSDCPSLFPALRPMYTYLSPTSTIQSFFGRPPAHIHPPLTFSLRVNLLFSLVHKGCYKCHIVIATMPATPHTAVLQYGLSFVIEYAASPNTMYYFSTSPC